ncbi:MAG: hemolysin family protein [Proteobacteria bacterium]|nr:hemolysin family protein [Pseudomonadota bacterium]
MEVPSNRSLLSIVKSKLLNKPHQEAISSIDPSEFEVLNNLEDYFNTTIREVMVPRTQMETIDKNAPIKEAIHLFHKTGFSRLPVLEGKRDNIVGILYAIDLFEYFESAESVLVLEIMRKPSFVSYSQKIHQVFSHFRTNKVQMAIVVDEHGGVDGLITIEDVIEELVGDIPDEFDKNDDPTYKSLSNGSVLMDANFPLSQFNELYNKDFQKEGIETIGGYVCHSAGKIPEKGERIELENLQLVVDESNDRRLEKLLISTTNP